MHAYINLVYGLACREYFVAQWLEQPSGVVECHRFRIPVGTQIFLSRARDMMITSFLISSLSLNLPSFFSILSMYLYGTLKKACNLSYQTNSANYIMLYLPAPRSFFCRLFFLNHLQKFILQILIFAFKAVTSLLKLDNSGLSLTKVLFTLLQRTLELVTKLFTSLGKEKKNMRSNCCFEIAVF